MTVTDPRGTIYLVDASIYIFRAWFSLPDVLTGIEGRPVNAVYGFLRFITDLLEQARPSHIAFAFDGSLTSSFRNEIYADYKANRESAPVELKAQFDMCRGLVSTLGMTGLVHERYEADDLIATVASNMRRDGFRSVIVSSDKDLMQVVAGQDVWWSFPKTERLTVDGVCQRLGVRPEQVGDYLALVGDAVDNIPGVPGIGAKSAARLLRLYPTLESIYDNLAQVPQLAIRGSGRIAASLKQHREQAFMARELTTLVSGIDMACGADEYRLRGVDAAALDTLVRQMDRGNGYAERIKQVLGP